MGVRTVDKSNGGASGSNLRIGGWHRSVRNALRNIDRLSTG